MNLAAPHARRLVAYLADLLIVWPAPVLLLVTLEKLATVSGVRLPAVVTDYDIAAVFLLELLYFSLLEGRGGQSLGKRAFRVAVTMRSGMALTRWRAALRTLVFLFVARGPALTVVALAPPESRGALGVGVLTGLVLVSPLPGLLVRRGGVREAGGVHDLATGTRVVGAPAASGAPSTSRALRDLLVPAAVLVAFLVPLTHLDTYRGDTPGKFALLREDAERRSIGLLSTFGHDVTGFQTAAVFWEDSEPFKYLAKSVGQKQAWETIEEHKLPLAGWRVRFFRPLHDEQFTVWWGIDGTPIGFRVEAPGLRPTPAPRQDVRRAVSAALGAMFPADAAQYELVAESSEDRGSTQVHSFVWRRRASPVDLRLYLRATAVGDQVQALSRVAEVPESFTRNERATDLRRSVLNGVAWSLNSFLSLAMMVFLLVAWQRRALRPGPTLVVAGTMALAQLLGLLNSIPLYWSEYAPREVPWVFWVSTLTPLFLDLALASAWAFAVFLAADAAGRLEPRGGHSLADLARPAFYVSETCARATVAGLAAVVVHRLAVDVFYALLTATTGTYAFGGYGYSNLLSTRMPWLKPLLAGLHAALTEEAAYRLFAISVLLLWTRRRWLALLLPAVLWAFLHTWYEIEPIWARGLELTIIGVFYGIVYLRFGIWATIVSHYVHNAWLTSALVQPSGDPWLIVLTTAIVFLPTLPLFLALGRLLRARAAGGYAVAPVAWTPRPSAASAPLYPRSDHPQVALNLWLAAPIAGLAALFTAILPGTAPPPSTTIDRARAIAIARSGLTALGHDLDGFRAAASLGDREPILSPIHYVRPPDRKDLADHAPRGGKGAGWSVRFFEPRRADECRAEIGADLQLRTFRCLQDESAAAPRLDLWTTRELGEQYLTARGIDVARLRYLGFAEQDHPWRVDHVHQWTVPAAGGEPARTITVGVALGRVSSFAVADEAPGAPPGPAPWRSAWAIVRDAARWLAVLALVALAVHTGLRRGPGETRLWHPIAALTGAAAAGIVVLEALNRVPGQWLDYDTATGTKAFAAREILGVVEAASQWAIAAYVVALLCLTLLPQVFRNAPGSPEMGALLRTAPWRWYGSRGAFAWALAILLVQVLERKLIATFSGHPADLFRTEYAAFAAAVPAAHVLVSVGLHLFFWAALAVVVAAAWRHWSAPLAAVAALLWVVGALTPGIEFVTQLSALAFVFLVARFHVPFYFWYTLLTAALSFLPWLTTGTGDLRRQAMFVWVAVLALVVMLFSGWRRRSPAKVTPVL